MKLFGKFANGVAWPFDKTFFLKKILEMRDISNDRLHPLVSHGMSKL